MVAHPPVMGYGFGPYPGCSWGQAPVDVPIVIWQDDDPEAQLVCFEKTMGTFGAHH